MKIIRGLHNLTNQHFSCVATIGNFDGVHLGHKAIIRSLNIKAKEFNLPSLVMIFEPHPKEYFVEVHPHATLTTHVSKGIARLCRFRDKIKLLLEEKVDHILVIRFNEKFANLSANDFVQNILHRHLHIRYLLIGDDFRYGANRTGDIEHLKQYAERYDFCVQSHDSCLYQSERISSTRIRHALQHGELAAAQAMLGYRYFISGAVQHGQKNGQRIGFPTANIRLPNQPPAITGVFAVTVTVNHQTTTYPGVANIGYRPTIRANKEAILEVHIFDFNEQLYGQHITTSFHKKIRQEKKFNSFDELKQQIMLDSQVAKDYFTQEKPL